MKKICITLLLITIVFQSGAQKTIQEKLGYPKDTKLLIIHADDMGVSHSENMATIHVMEKGVVNSGSIMVPCPWFPEIATYAKEHPEADLGLHLTLTSEWKFYKWGPVTSRAEVASLLDDKGFFHESTMALMTQGKAAEVERELRGQIALARQYGIDPTHFDAHMAGAVSTKEFFQVLLKLGREYKVPVLISREFLQFFRLDASAYISENDVVVDKLFIARSEDYKKGMEQYYTNVLKSVGPGLNCILLHAAYDNEEMKAITTGHVDYGSAWRQADVNFFTSEKCKKLINDENIKLITWREIRDRIVR